MPASDAAAENSGFPHEELDDAPLLAAVFCPGCQFPVTPLADDRSFATPPRHDNRLGKATSARCPRCGNPLPDPVHSAVLSTSLREGQPTGGPLRASQETQVDELIGRDLGIYHMEAFLGAGAMGRVYLARHRDLRRYCAVKILPPRLVASDPQIVDRLLNEGQAAAALNHPHIVTTHAVGEADGYSFLEMEFVPGRSLRQMIVSEGRLAPLHATTIIARLADGLAAAHRARILHRDLKPDNVLLTHQGIPKITDFGLARRVVFEDQWHHTRDIVGTPQYMAPELFAGQSATPASDVYSLGVCYFELLTGRLPFEAVDLPDQITATTQAPLPNVRELIPEIPLEMAECLYQLLARAPENRPQTAIEAAQLLEAILGQAVDLGQLIEQAFRHQPNISWQREEASDRFRIQLKLNGGRRQIAFVEPSQHAIADRLLTIFSICCPTDANYYEAALKLNGEILHGALAIREIDGQSVFVMIDNYPRTTVDPEEIRRSVLEVAHRADAIEKLLTGLDLH